MAGPTPPLDSARLAQRRPMFRRITPRSTNKQAPPSHTSERVQELAESWRSYRNDIEQEKVQKAVQRRKREVLKRLLTKEAAAKGIEATAFSLLGVPVTEERVEEKPGDDTPKQSRRPVYLPIELSVLNKRVRLNDDDAAHSQGELASDCISRESGAQSARPPTLRSSRANIRRDSEPSLQSARGRVFVIVEKKILTPSLLLLLHLPRLFPSFSVFFIVSIFSVFSFSVMFFPFSRTLTTRWKKKNFCRRNAALSLDDPFRRQRDDVFPI